MAAPRVSAIARCSAAVLERACVLWFEEALFARASVPCECTSAGGLSDAELLEPLSASGGEGGDANTDPMTDATSARGGETISASEADVL